MQSRQRRVLQQHDGFSIFKQAAGNHLQGLFALREICGVPVVAQASFVAAAARGPFAVVTGGKAWGPMLERFARMHRLDAQLVGIHTVELTGMQIAAAPEAAMDDLSTACRLGIEGGASCSVGRH